MNNTQKVDSRTRDSLAPTVADMLTVSLQESKALINRTSLFEASNVLGAFSTSVVDYGKSARKWRAHTLSRLPLEHWKHKDGFFYVAPLKEASLKYMSTTAPDAADENAWNQLENRKAVHKALVEILPAQVRQQYAAMLEWTQIEPQSETQPVLEDMALARSIYALDQLFYREYAVCEARLRREKGFADGDSIPCDWIGWLADKAAQKVDAHLYVWGVQPLPWQVDERDEAGQQPAESSVEGIYKPDGELTLELLCNLVGNRALLESARIAELADQATKVSTDLLHALNRNGKCEVPEVRNCNDLRNELTAWFGDEGVLAREPGFGTPLKGHNLEVALYHALEVQKHYVKTRGAIDPSAHRNPDNRFIFALALVACFYAQVSLDKEYSGSTYATYAVFPAQNKAQRFEPLPAHAREMLMSLYGQMFYANTGWEIRAEAIEAYAQNFALKRSCLQELTFNTFKRMAPERLLALHQKLARMGESKKTRLLQSMPEGAAPPSEMACILAAIDDLFSPQALAAAR